MTLEWAVALRPPLGTIGSNCRLFKSTVLSSYQVEFSNAPWWIRIEAAVSTHFSCSLNNQVSASSSRKALSNRLWAECNRNPLTYSHKCGWKEEIFKHPTNSLYKSFHFTHNFSLLLKPSISFLLGCFLLLSYFIKRYHWILLTTMSSFCVFILPCLYFYKSSGYK